MISFGSNGSRTVPPPFVVAWLRASNRAPVGRSLPGPDDELP